MNEGESGSVLTGSSETDWRTGLDESLRTDPSLADIKDISGLAKSYIHAQKMIGRDKVAIPQEGATEDEWNSFYDRLGRPGTYEINTSDLKYPENWPQHENIDKFKDNLLSVYHKAGLTNSQANAIHTGLMQELISDFEQSQSTIELEREGWRSQLEKDFGRAFDQQVDLAQRAAREFGGEEVLNWLEESGMGDNPTVVKMFAKIGAKMTEASVNNGAGAASFALTPDAARQEIARLQRDPVFMKQYSSTEMDGHREAIEKMQSLFEFAYPDEEAA